MSDLFRENLQKEAVEIALEKESGTICVSVRTGKTKIGLDIAKTYEKVVVVYPNLTIKRAWELDSEKFGISLENITFSTYLSLNKLNLKDYDCLIMDEEHDCSEATLLFISANKPKHIYGLTATPSNRGFKKTWMDKNCPIIYKKTLEDTVGKTNKDFRITVHLLEPSSEKNILLKSGKYWSEKAKISFFESKYERDYQFQSMIMLIRTIQDSPTKLNYLKNLTKTIDRGLIFVETSKQCDFLGFPAYHTKEKNSEENLEKFQNKEINILSTINQLKQGYTFTDLNRVVILHCYSSNAKSSQKLGRCLNYVEGEVAEIDIICLNNSRDLKWTKAALQDYNPEKITWKQVK